jgi:hypothetical protein
VFRQDNSEPVFLPVGRIVQNGFTFPTGRKRGVAGSDIQSSLRPLTPLAPREKMWIVQATGFTCGLEFLHF